MNARGAGRIAAGVLVGAWCAAAPGPAAAQEPAAPDAPPPGPGAPLRLTPDPPGPPPPLGAQDNPGPAPLAPPEAPDTVAIGEIEALGGDAAGALGPHGGGFANDVWRGGDGARLLALMRLAPVSAPSPALRDLARRLLATAAAPPAGALPEGAFANARIALLSRIGAFEEAALTAEAAGEAAAWPRAEAHFWLGELDRACALARAAVAAQPTRQWRRALVLCQVHGGEADAAGLTLALLADRAEESELPYLRLAAHLLDQLSVDSPILDDGLGFAASVAAELPIAPEAAAALEPGPARALAERPGVAIGTRLAAAERAAATGALEPEALGEIYALFASSDSGPAATEAAPASDAPGRARLYAAARAAGGAARAAALAALWTPAPGSPGPVALARATAEMTLALTPGAGVAPDGFAARAARMLTAAGRDAAAAAWLRAEDDPAARWRGLPPVAAAGAEWRAETAARWWRAAPLGMAPEERAARADRVFMVLDALGRPIGADGWALFLDEPREMSAALPNIGLRYGLRDALREGRAGEAILHVWILLGEGGPAGAGSLALGAAVRALRALGLDDEARAVALEALIGDAW